MSGHSKWSKVKHQKATTDVVKGAAFTKAARGITLAVIEGGGIADPNLNFHLRLAIEKARDVNMPKENIARAIDKGKGADRAALEHVTYEGYGPHGSAILVETATDNKTRTVSLLKNIFDKHNGSIASPGSVSYLFARTGVLTIAKGERSYDEMIGIAIDAGADEVVEREDAYELYTPVSACSAVIAQLEQKTITIDNTVIIMKPNSPVQYETNAQTAIDEFVEKVTQLDDVQHVFTNCAD